jgi:hypothetical protein
MAELLTTLVQRQTLMRQDMMTMHNRMMGDMRDRMRLRAMPDDEGWPDEMCTSKEWERSQRTAKAPVRHFAPWRRVAPATLPGAFRWALQATGSVIRPPEAGLSRL